MLRLCLCLGEAVGDNCHVRQKLVQWSRDDLGDPSASSTPSKEMPLDVICCLTSRTSAPVAMNRISFQKRLLEVENNSQSRHRNVHTYMRQFPRFPLPPLLCQRLKWCQSIVQYPLTQPIPLLCRHPAATTTTATVHPSDLILHCGPRRLGRAVSQHRLCASARD